MKIATTYDNGQIFQHFGHTEYFRIYEIEDGKIKSAETLPTNCEGHGALPVFLKEHGVDILICGGIGGGAIAGVQRQGIQLYGGASGSADAAVENLLAHKLEYDNDAVCDHHSHDGGSCPGHTCGEHSCH